MSAKPATATELHDRAEAIAEEAPPVEALDRLRQPFPPSQVGKLPRITCRSCSESRTKVCDEHRKSECSTCGNWITSRHIHLDYVGHGAVTDRLLEVDPEWTWEPVAWDPNGLPLMERDRNGNPINLWMRLTVGGVTRLGCGTCPSGQFEAEKVLIGDALRNAAMRFGVALDLWIKGHGEDDEVSTATTTQAAPERGQGWQRGHAKQAVFQAVGEDKALAEGAWAHLDGDNHWQEWEHSFPQAALEAWLNEPVDGGEVEALEAVPPSGTADEGERDGDIDGVAVPPLPLEEAQT